MDISLSSVSELDITLSPVVDFDVCLLPAEDMADYRLDHVEEFNTELENVNNIDIEMDTGIIVSGSKVIINPPDDPTDSMEKIKVDDKTYDILEKDPTVPGWSKAPQKPAYTAGEVGAVDVDNELKYSEIDRIFRTVFG